MHHCLWSCNPPLFFLSLSTVLKTPVFIAVPGCTGGCSKGWIFPWSPSQIPTWCFFWRVLLALHMGVPYFCHTCSVMSNMWSTPKPRFTFAHLRRFLGSWTQTHDLHRLESMGNAQLCISMVLCYAFTATLHSAACTNLSEYWAHASGSGEKTTAVLLSAATLELLNCGYVHFLLTSHRHADTTSFTASACSPATTTSGKQKETLSGT